MNCGYRWKWEVIIAVNFPIYAIGNWKPEKNSGFNGIRTRDLRVTGATELWSHTLGARSIVGSHFPVRGVKRCKVYEIIHIWTADIDESEKWSSQWIFQFMQLEIGSLKKIQASNFQLHKLENSLRWSLLTFIYIRSSYMNYFIYFTS